MGKFRSSPVKTVPSHHDSVYVKCKSENMHAKQGGDPFVSKQDSLREAFLELLNVSRFNMALFSISALIYFQGF